MTWTGVAEYHAIIMTVSLRTALMVIVHVLIVTACQTEAQTAKVDDGRDGVAPNTAGISVEDTGGHVVRLPRPARRIASLAPGFSEILFEIGCGDRVALRDNWSNYPARVTSVPAVDGLDPSAATIAGYDPDLVLLCFENPRHRTAFEHLGMPLAMMEPRTYEDVVRDVLKLGVLCGAEDRAAVVSQKMKETRERISREASGLERPLVYVELDGSDPARPWTAGPGSFMDELLTTAGGRNAAESAGARYAQVNAEAIVRSNPQVVILMDNSRRGSQGGAVALANRPGWSEVDAVKQGRVYDHLDKDALSRPGPRLAMGLEELFEALHPERERGAVR